MSFPQNRPSPGQQRPRDHKSRCLERLPHLHHCPLLAWPCPPAPIQQAVSFPFVELVFRNFKLITKENHSSPLQPYISFIPMSLVISHILHMPPIQIKVVKCQKLNPITKHPQLYTGRQKQLPKRIIKTCQLMGHSHTALHDYFRRKPWTRHILSILLISFLLSHGCVITHTLQ